MAKQSDKKPSKEAKGKLGPTEAVDVPPKFELSKTLRSKLPSPERATASADLWE